MDQIIGNSIVRLEVTDSTNNYAKQQIRENGLSEGTVFLAHEQTAGRGQQKNSWESEPGENLLFSIVLCPDFLEIRRQFMLSKVVALGIYKALNKYVDSLKIKWPNDIYAGNQKLGGILIENSVMSGLLKSAVVGIGLNVNQTLFPAGLITAVSIKQATGKTLVPVVAAQELCECLENRYQQLQQRTASLLPEYNRVLYKAGEQVKLRTSEKVIETQIVGVKENGLLRTVDETNRFFRFGEVEWIR